MTTGKYYMYSAISCHSPRPDSSHKFYNGARFCTGFILKQKIMDDLKFVTGETLANDVGYFVIGISVSFGLIIDMKHEMSLNR